MKTLPMIVSHLTGEDWWTPELASLRKKVRKLFNRSSKSKAPEDDEAFLVAQTKFKEEL